MPPTCPRPPLRPRSARRSPSTAGGLLAARGAGASAQPAPRPAAHLRPTDLPIRRRAARSLERKPSKETTERRKRRPEMSPRALDRLTSLPAAAWSAWAPRHCPDQKHPSEKSPAPVPTAPSRGRLPQVARPAIRVRPRSQWLPDPQLVLPDRRSCLFPPTGVCDAVVPREADPQAPRLADRSPPRIDSHRRCSPRPSPAGGVRRHAANGCERGLQQAPGADHRPGAHRMRPATQAGRPGPTRATPRRSSPSWGLSRGSTPSAPGLVSGASLSS